ncbi:EF-hand domain-containing protein [archaeon]|nr:MAG: EF-hand domain-containing protein [archaeon]
MSTKASQSSAGVVVESSSGSDKGSTQSIDKAAVEPFIDADSATLQSVDNEVMKYISSLNSNTLKWMNKRRPKNANAIPGHVMPSIALQLKQMFDNFDFDHSGEIDIVELKNAVKFVADSCPDMQGKSQSVADTKAITDFFTQMDANHNGVVDFVEFLAAVTTKNSENEALEVAKASRRLQAEFLQFATKLRRQRILNNLSSDDTSSSAKVNGLKQLYSINYFMDSLEVEKDPTKYKQQLKEFNGGALQARRKRETERTREAAALIKQNKRAQTLCQAEVRHFSRPSHGPRVMVQGKDMTDSVIVHVPLPKIRTHVHHAGGSAHTQSAPTFLPSIVK